MKKRVNLFRGKSNGKWVYGYLSDENTIYCKETNTVYICEEGSIGEYIGKVDGKDNGIFEGDIFTIFPDNKERYIVSYNDGRWEMHQKGDEEFEYQGLDGFDTSMVTVVDNVFDEIKRNALKRESARLSN